ncbi:MAG: glycerol-3-phosphate 1-O-acyltransferase PlsY [Gammaproteobacteria bacterium]
MTTIILIVIAYLVGSLSSAVLVAKFFNVPDPRTQGSGNPGATNMLRLAGKLPAIITLLADALKGALPVFFAVLIDMSGFSLGLIALAAVLGHIFPIFFKFQGGKGVATFMGALIALSPLTGLIAVIAWIAIALVTRYASLASLLACAVATGCTLFFEPGAFIPVLLTFALIAWRHLENIKLLQQGLESKIEF